jgi:uncharacterized protein (TIGR00730 family)
VSEFKRLNTELQAEVEHLLDLVGARERRTQLAEVLAAAVSIAADGGEPLDLKIIAAALSEMHDAFTMFRPYRAFRKVTIFGSARTAKDEPLYEQARSVAEMLAAHGWMVITGAGPGLMQAAMEGAGRENSFGVTIRLPWEGGANSIIADDPKLVSMKYFFTRKLMLIKESHAFICLPGGFGTLDETFELLTLTQTGKGVPVPIVFLDTPGAAYWSTWANAISDVLVDRGMIGAEDHRLFRVTDSAATAVEEIDRFYRNFDSIRFVGDRLVIRVRHAPDDARLARLNETFSDLVRKGSIERIGATRVERDDGDRLELDRLALAFDPRKTARLRLLINALNEP